MISSVRAKITLAVSCTVGLLCSAAIAGTPKSPAAPDFLPMSVWYSGGKARAPMLSEITPESEGQWRADLLQIRALGFNTVRTWVEWAHCEPRRGQLRFDNLRLLCRLAREVGLRVVIQVYADSAPDWVGQLHADAMFEAQSGAKVPSQAAPGYCTDKPDVQQLVANFYTQAARVASEYPNVVAWDLWSEPHIINWAVITYVPNAQFCFCPHTRTAFRNWLMHKYGSLEQLNRAWYRSFESIEQAEPPRFGTILSYTDFIDWKSFIYAKLASDLRLRAEAIRAGHPEGIITSHAAVPSIFTSPFSGDGASDDFLMAREIDFYGTSIYPKHSFPSRHWPIWQINVAMDFSRSANLANGGFYIGELQAGYGTRGVVVSDPVTSEDVRLWMWKALGHGARAVNLYAYYPMSSGYESGGYGLVELDGTLTPRAEEAGRIAQLVTRHQDLFLQSRPMKAEVAIVYNPLSQMVGGEQSSGPEGGHRDSLIGYHRALHEECIPVDFIHRQSLESGALEQYRLVIVPYPLMFTPKAAEGLARYVSNGGSVVAEARLAWNDERGFASPVIPGMGLAEVFGVRESRVQMLDEVPMKLSADAGDALLTGLAAGATLKGAFFAESFEPLDGHDVQVIARHANDTPAIVASRHGKGRTMAIGAFLGMGAHRTANAGADATAGNAFIRNMLRWAGIEPRLVRSRDAAAPQPVDVHVLEGKDGAVVIALNHATTPQKTELSLRMADPDRLIADDLLDGAEMQSAVEAGRLKIVLPVEARNVRVLRLRSRG